ncbi:hypothetical protein BCB68_05355 [Leptotrichia sp. oral taxon 498]|jgi:hypothetical protein|uniref:hypothetical protein n=1 Tax=Leptotrichia sp. oral taxon 498 TaxID=712368 RepID=UPI000B8CA585|nr:hypothetical protein [Leptotrichia sp. oral taxon 498]ASQ48406.1 hypothetical protein BCB68_05355 [Leptotrichia sp. oral taxon 498]
MTVYIVKESFIYGGKIQNIGEEVQILEKDVIENCIDRGLIEKKDNKKADINDIPEETGVSDSESKSDKNKKK